MSRGAVWWRVLRDRLRALLFRERVTSEIREELDHHQQLLAGRLEQEGLAPAEAAREARRRVGNVALLQDAGYDVRGGGPMEQFVQDLRYAVRGLRRSPAFTLVALATLALGIGANTAIFSVANGLLLRPLPYPDADRLAMVWLDNTRLGLDQDWHSFANYDDYRTQAGTFEDMAAFNRRSATVTGHGEAERVMGAHATANLFAVLGVSPALGRVYTADEDRPGADDVVVLSNRYWQRRFGGDSGVLDEVVEMSGRRRRVIGVMPDDFAFPTRDVEFWTPTAAPEDLRSSRDSFWLQVVGRRKPGVSVEQAQADLDRVAAGIVEAFPDQDGYGVNVVAYFDQVVGSVRPAVLMLLGAVACVLLIACTNVAHLLLARASGREREFAVRAAIGAGRGRLVRQVLTESLLLGIIGGALGVGLAWVGLDVLLRVAPDDLPRLDAIRLDRQVLAFTALLSVATGVLFGLVPAVQMARANPGHAMKDGARGTTGLGRSLRRGLVVAEVTLAVLLLVGAGLMIKSLVRLQQVAIGLRTEGVLTGRVTLSGERYAEAPAVVDLFASVIERVEAHPLVERAAGIGTVFLSATPNSTNFSIEGRPPFAPDEQIEVPLDAVTPGYFDVMGVPLLEGRAFDARDVSGAPIAVIINETMARRFWPDASPVGTRMKYGSLTGQSPWMTIVGVVADTRRTGYDAPVRPETYLSHAQYPERSLALVVRTTGAPEAAAPVLREAVRAADARLPVYAVAPLADELDEMTAQRRLNTLLLSIFGVVAAGLASIGIYGVMAYAVEQRTRELGVRLALGASRASILALILREAAALAAAGLLLGLGVSLLLSRTVAAMLYDVSATDPSTYVAIGLVTAVTAIGAALVPALRSLRVSPIAALRID